MTNDQIISLTDKLVKAIKVFERECKSAYNLAQLEFYKGNVLPKDAAVVIKQVDVRRENSRGRYSIKDIGLVGSTFENLLEGELSSQSSDWDKSESGMEDINETQYEELDEEDDILTS